MKGVKKCYGLLLVSLITLGVSLSVCSGNINALKHEYAGIPLLDPQVPSSSSRGYDCSSGKCLKPASGFDISRQSVSSFGGTFTLEFNGDSYNSSYDSISPLYSSSPSSSPSSDSAF